MLPSKLPSVSSKVHGHPATANHVAYLVNSGMTLESLAEYPEPINAFHDKTLDGIFSSKSLTQIQLDLLYLLSWFPSLPTTVVSEIFPEASLADIVRDLWELNAYSLTTQAEGGYYALPAVVAARFLRNGDPLSSALYMRVARLLRDKFEAGATAVELIDSLTLGIVALQDAITDVFRGIVGPSTLLSVVEHEYEAGLSVSTANVAEYFKRAYELAKMSINRASCKIHRTRRIFPVFAGAERPALRPARA